MSYTLEPWQRSFFRDTCDIWTTDETPSTDGLGAPGAIASTLAASNVPYYHEQTPNVDDGTEVGSMTRPTVFTTDKAHFPAGAPVPNAGVIKNTTAGSPLNGFYTILGAAQQHPNRGRMRPNKQMAMVRQILNVPAGVS